MFEAISICLSLLNLALSIALYRAVIDAKKALSAIESRLLYIDESSLSDRDSSIINATSPDDGQEAVHIDWDDGREYWHEVESKRKG